MRGHSPSARQHRGASASRPPSLRRDRRESAQASLLADLDATISGEATLTDAGGTTLLRYAPAKSHESLIVSMPEMAAGQGYVLSRGSLEANLSL